MVVIEVGGEVYIIVGESDDGLTLKMLLPDGTLLQLGIIDATLLTGLQNHGSVSLIKENGHMRLFLLSRMAMTF